MVFPNFVIFVSFVVNQYIPRWRSTRLPLGPAARAGKVEFEIVAF
jgi:hypothetical protein